MKFYEMSDFKKRSSTGFVLFVFFAVITLASSCITTKKIVYFRDLPDTMPKPVVMDQAAPYTEPKIESNDLLAITVQPMLQTVAGSSSNGGASQSSPGGASSAAQGPGQGASTYLVDQNGEIEYPLIGTVKLAGLTITEAKNLIKEKAKVYYNDPVVNVRITNFDITVLGDVTRPLQFNSPSEKISVLDALAYCGDLNLTARRDNILLIRSNGDQKVFSRYDISSKSVFASPNYYLKQHDIIYVEPNKFKVQSSDQTFIRNLGILSSLISLASLVLVFKSLK